MFNSLAATIVSDRISEGSLPDEPTAVDLGNQTYAVDDPVMARIIGKLEASSAARRYRVDFGKLRSMLRNGAGPGTGVEEFYKAVGFARYEAIDLNSRHGSRTMDLNEDLAEHGLAQGHDLVVNAGTSEHVFNQASVFRNAHNLANVGGRMIHIVPATGYFNHGFYNYQPGLFLDLSMANAYALEGLYLADRTGVLLDLGAPGEILAHFQPYLGLAARNDKSNTFIVAVVRKTSADAFRCPCQGKYVRVIESVAIRETYAGQVAASPSTAKLGLQNSGRDKAPLTRRLRRKLKTRLLNGLRATSRFVLLHL